MNKRPEYITIGRFGRPRGVSGDIYITPDTDYPDRFLELDEIFVVDGKSRTRMTIESATMLDNRPVLKIIGFDSREQASRLTNLSIEIPGDLAVDLPEGSHFQFDLAGCAVTGEDGTDYGILEEVLFYPSSDLYRIVSKRFGEVLLPVVDRFIKSIDIEKKIIIISPPDGLFEVRDD